MMSPGDDSDSNHTINKYGSTHLVMCLEAQPLGPWRWDVRHWREGWDMQEDLGRMK